jgi:hypothetical protein
MAAEMEAQRTAWSLHLVFNLRAGYLLIARGASTSGAVTGQYPLGQHHRQRALFDSPADAHP